jgi:hypothetical protein
VVDRRTRREKIEAMARDKSSPNEAAIARRMLGEAPVDPPLGRRTSPRYRQTTEDGTIEWEVREDGVFVFHGWDYDQANAAFRAAAEYVRENFKDFGFIRPSNHFQDDG